MGLLGIPFIRKTREIIHFLLTMQDINFLFDEIYKESKKSKKNDGITV